MGRTAAPENETIAVNPYNKYDIHMTLVIIVDKVNICAQK